MKEQIIQCAKEAYKHRKSEGNVSEHTKNAQYVARLWRSSCWEINPSRIDYEVSIHPEFNEKIDVLDIKEMCAYELKVSGKNAMFEFYKDIVKILLWNYKRNDKKIKKLVFITESVWGKKYLNSTMPQAYIRYINTQGLQVEIEYIDLVSL